MRFSSGIVQASFERLRETVAEGKTGTERTSALMYFLAFDAAFVGVDLVSLDPDTPSGNANRKRLTNQYSKFVTLRTCGLSNVWSVCSLGSITRYGADPAKRISSNFLTTPLKKASERAKPMDYPSRPCPLLCLGPGLGAGNWGIKAHSDWERNISMFLSERVSRVPFTDLAIFTLRDSEFSPKNTLNDTLMDLICIRFSKRLTSYWAKQLSRESKSKGLPQERSWYGPEYHRAFEDEDWIARIGFADQEAMQDDRVTYLEKRVSYLECLLKEHRINFKT